MDGETNAAVAVARSFPGVRMYSEKAEDRHWPNVCIRESLRPAIAAVVAAPIQKLWPL